MIDFKFVEDTSISLYFSQNFIRRCLQYKKDMRPDVMLLANDDYLKPASLKARGG